jgi:organic hydroperoxide reductase OsmC/OhrA
VSSLDRTLYLNHSSKSQYTVTATSTGGREGTRSSTPTDETAPLNLKLTTPKAIGGRGDRGHNPEQLFAGGYSGKLNQNQYLYFDICMIN